MRNGSSCSAWIAVACVFAPWASATSSLAHSITGGPRAVESRAVASRAVESRAVEPLAIEPIASVRGDDETRAQIERYFELARGGRPVIRPQAAQRLAALGEPAARFVLERTGGELDALAKLGPELVGILGELGDARLRAACWRALDDRDFPWRPAAAASLARTAAGEGTTRPTGAPSDGATRGAANETTGDAKGETSEQATGEQATGEQATGDAAGDASPAERERRRSEDEGARFEALLSDPIPQVRRAAIDGLAALDRRSAADALARARFDERGEVRRRAAELLARWGNAEWLWLLCDELQREDRFFSIPTGLQARHEAWRMLRGLVEFDALYDPEKGRVENDAGLRAIRAALLERAPREPECGSVLVGSLPAPAVLGLEVRSCRRGEFFLRWLANDTLAIGLGDRSLPSPWLRFVELEPGTTARLKAALTASLGELGDQRFWGAPGCDLERLYLVGADGKTETLLVSKGPDAVEGLRPQALAAPLRAMLATLPSEPEAGSSGAALGNEEPRAEGEVALAARVRDALAVVGGALVD